MIHALEIFHNNGQQVVLQDIILKAHVCVCEPARICIQMMMEYVHEW